MNTLFRRNNYLKLGDQSFFFHSLKKKMSDFCLFLTGHRRKLSRNPKTRDAEFPSRFLSHVTELSTVFSTVHADFHKPGREAGSEG